MNLNKALVSTHSLKKSSYRMLKKMHSLERRGVLRTCSQLGGEYYIILCLQHMSDVIKQSYSNNAVIPEIVLDIGDLILVLKESFKSRMRVDRALLTSCLKKHTKVFNCLEKNGIKINKNDVLSETWNMKCIVSYVCQFGNHI